MMGWFESVQVYLFCHHSFCGNTEHCWCIWICWRLWYFLYGWFQMSYIFSFVECNVLIGVIWHKNIHRCFSFNVVYAIHNVYVGIFPLCWILIADEVCHMSFDCMAFDLDWNDAIMSWWYFESLPANPNSCLLLTIYSVGEKSAILLYVTVPFLIPGIWQGYFSGYQFQIVFPCLVVCHIW